jgi:hypothetical protein
MRTDSLRLSQAASTPPWPARGRQQRGSFTDLFEGREVRHFFGFILVVVEKGSQRHQLRAMRLLVMTTARQHDQGHRVFLRFRFEIGNARLRIRGPTNPKAMWRLGQMQR